MSTFTLWTLSQACLWIASRDDAAVASLPENYTFAVLAFHVELELIDSDDDHTVVIDEGHDLRSAPRASRSNRRIPGAAKSGYARHRMD